LTLVDRSKITVDQDKDAPEDVEVDETSVKKAVKALADTKKHLVKSGEGSGTRTGGRYGGGKGGQDEGTDKDQALALKYNI
jgi:hypothetical protein